MGHWSDPKVIIPHYDVPPGTLFQIQNVHGLTTFEKQPDGGWEPVAFDKNLGTKLKNSLTNRQERG